MPSADRYHDKSYIRDQKRLLVVLPLYRLFSALVLLIPLGCATHPKKASHFQQSSVKSNSVSQSKASTIIDNKYIVKMNKTQNTHRPHSKHRSEPVELGLLSVQPVESFFLEPKRSDPEKDASEKTRNSLAIALD